MNVETLAKLVVVACQDEQVDYMMAGAFAYGVYGIPRSTKDVDVVVSITDPGLIDRVIKRLEDELGGSLLHRDGKDTRLTPLGRDVQTEFMGMLKIEERVRVLAETSIHGRRETLSIGLASTLSPVAISGFLNLVLKELPSVELVFRPLTHMSGLDAVLAGDIDGCFLAGGPDSHPKLSIVELFSENLMLC